MYININIYIYIIYTVLYIPLRYESHPVSRHGALPWSSWSSHRAPSRHSHDSEPGHAGDWIFLGEKKTSQPSNIVELWSNMNET